jgi:hypothetical protein
VGVRAIIPYAGRDPDRERAVAWVLDHCDYPYTVALGELPFNKALTVMPAVERSDADIVVMHDADVWAPGLAEAVNAVEEGAAWAIPHWKVYRLTQSATHTLLRSASAGQDSTAWLATSHLARLPYVGVAGGGIVVTRRDTMLDIPLDPRFTTWGQEDESWAMALWCLLGPPWRGEAPLIHLWHPLEPRQGQRKGSQAGWDLRNRYVRVRTDLPGMRDLLSEARDALLLSC